MPTGGRFSNELKTGIVVAVALVILAVAAYLTGHLTVGRRTSEAKAYFGFTAGVKKLAPVRLSGVEVGEVKNVNLLYGPEETRIEVIFRLDPGTRLRRDSVATVSSLGLMGEKYVEIHPGTSTEFISAGDTIEAKDPIAFDELMEKAKDIADEIEVTLADFRSLVKHADEILVENKPKINRMLGDLEEASEYLEEFSEDIRYHPWKVLTKGKEKTPEELERLRAERRAKKEAAQLEKKSEKEEAAETGRKSPFDPRRDRRR